MPGKRELKTKHSNPVAAAAGGMKKTWLIPSIAGAALAGVFAGFCVAAGASDFIAPHTVIAGEDVGGLTRAETVWALDDALDTMRRSSGVHTLLEDGTEAAFFTYDDLGADFDADQLAEDAYRSSHSGNVLADGWNLLTATLGRTSVVAPQPEDGWESAAAERIAEATHVEAQNFSHTVLNDTTLRLTKEKSGRSTDSTALRARLSESEADASGSRTVTLPYEAIPGTAGDLAALNEELGGEGANAKYDAETKSIVPEHPALHFDVAQAQSMLDAAAPGTSVDVPAESFQPQVTAKDLEKVLFRDLLGTYTTKVGGAAGRKANVKLTAQRVNGVVLNSGETFNYYDYTGPFTGANGYQSAPGYLHGKTVEMDGGGACQCSSTLYAASLLANLEIVARTAHGFASDYIGLGMDATVSGGGPDFIFRNNTLYPIRIETVYSDNNRLTVNLYGTKTDNITVKMRTEVLSKTPFEEEIIEDPELAPGERKVEQTAYTGYSVRTYRQLYEGDKLLSESLEARSNYKSRNRIVRVGPSAEAAEAPAATETPAAEPPATETPVAETPAPAPTEPVLPPEIPGGIDPTPIDQQIEGLAA